MSNGKMLELEYVSNGLVSLRDKEYGQVILSRCKTRKIHQCKSCAIWFDKGSMMYRPMGNGFNRMDRYCIKCIEDKD